MKNVNTKKKATGIPVVVQGRQVTVTPEDLHSLVDLLSKRPSKQTKVTWQVTALYGKEVGDAFAYRLNPNNVTAEEEFKEAIELLDGSPKNAKVSSKVLHWLVDRSFEEDAHELDRFTAARALAVAFEHIYTRK